MTNILRHFVAGCRWTGLACLVGFTLQLYALPVVAQPASSVEERQTRKVEVERPEPPVEEAADVRGMTYVAVSNSLESVVQEGRDPITLQELKALERQQTLVAAKIEQVTVNIQQGAAQGSGVIITPNGFVLTAAHVAGDADREAWVLLSDGTRLRARTYGLNRSKDAGLMKIIEPRDTPWPHATLGKSSEIQTGQWVVAAGHPGGWKSDRGSVIRVGRVLRIRYSSAEDDPRMSAHTLFTDCALIGGDSGGPLFTLDGKLVGIHSRIGTDVVDNMHVPIDVFDDSWDRMMNKEVWGVLPGYQPAIGVLKAKGDDRPLIAEVLPDSPAQRAGLAPGDLVLRFDGERITTFDHLRAGIGNKSPGDTVVLEVQRGEQVFRIPVVVGIAEQN